MTVTAVVVGHRNLHQIYRMLRSLREDQTQPPDEIIACVCCCDVSGIDADIVVRDRHIDDVGQRLCDYGLRLATSDYVFFASCDDEYECTFIEEMAKHDADIIHCDFYCHLQQKVVRSQAKIRETTRGGFLVRRALAQDVGYNHRDYEGDGKFIEDLKASGASDIRVARVLHRHL